jgi:hypothetical protein
VLSPSGVSFHLPFYAGFVKSSGGLYSPFGVVVLMKVMFKKKKKNLRELGELIGRGRLPPFLLKWGIYN